MFHTVLIAATAFAMGFFVGVVAWIQLTSTPAAADASANSLDKKRLMAVLAQLRNAASSLLENVSEHSVTIDGANNQIKHAMESDHDPLEAVLLVLSEITAANKRMKEKLDEARITIQRQTQLLEVTTTEARTDSLTALANRRAFDEELNLHFSGPNPVSVVILDIDHFKRFNDTHGHVAGDAILRGVAQVLKTCIRKSDVAARYGGEEFAVIFAGTPSEDAQKQAERIRAKIAASIFRCDNVDHEVTVSVGCAERAKGESSSSVLKRTDAALYAAKAAGRNAARFHDTLQCVAIPPARPLPEKQVYRVRLPSMRDEPRQFEGAASN